VPCSFADLLVPGPGSGLILLSTTVILSPPTATSLAASVSRSSVHKSYEMFAWPADARRARNAASLGLVGARRSATFVAEYTAASCKSKPVVRCPAKYRPLRPWTAARERAARITSGVIDARPLDSRGAPDTGSGALNGTHQGWGVAQAVLVAPVPGVVQVLSVAVAPYTLSS